MNKRGQMFVVTAIVIIMMIWLMTSTYNTFQEEVALENFEDLASNYKSESPKVINYAIVEGEDKQIAIKDFSDRFVKYARGIGGQPKFGMFYIVQNDRGEYVIHNFLPGKVIKLSGKDLTGKAINLNVASDDFQSEGKIGLDIGGMIFYNTVSTDVVNYNNDYAEADLGKIGEITVNIPGFQKIDLKREDLEGGFAGSMMAEAEGEEGGVNIEVENIHED